MTHPIRFHQSDFLTAQQLENYNKTWKEKIQCGSIVKYVLRGKAGDSLLYGQVSFCYLKSIGIKGSEVQLPLVHVQSEYGLKVLAPSEKIYNFTKFVNDDDLSITCDGFLIDRLMDDYSRVMIDCDIDEEGIYPQYSEIMSYKPMF